MRSISQMTKYLVTLDLGLSPNYLKDGCYITLVRFLATIDAEVSFFLWTHSQCSY